MHLSGAIEQIGIHKNEKCMSNIYIGQITFWDYGILVYIMFFSIF